MALLILVLVSGYGFGQEKKPEVTIGGISISMPNDKWALTAAQTGDRPNYLFKRECIVDKDGIEVLPVIMVFVEKARRYQNDVGTFAIEKQLAITPYGVNVESILTKETNKGYPISITNSMFYRCNYVSDSLQHDFNMIYIIHNKKAIQIYMDMTKSVAETCGKEFEAVIRSIKAVL